MRKGAELVLALLVVLLSADFARRHFLANFVLPEASIGKLAEFTSTTPYQYRVLVPALVRWIFYGLVAVGAGVSRIVIAISLEFLAVVAAFYALRALFERFVSGTLGPVLGALALFLVLPFNFIFPKNWPYWYPWDVPALTFTAIGLLLIHDRRWKLYYPLFIAATLNRETSCFLTIVLLLTWYQRLPLRQLLAHVAAQAVIWIAIKVAIERAFADHEGYGRFYSEALRDNMVVVSDWKNWPLLFSNFGYLWIPIAIGFRRIESPFIRRALWVVPLFVAIVFKTAQFDELRAYGEMIPIVLLGAVGLTQSVANAKAS